MGASTGFVAYLHVSAGTYPPKDGWNMELCGRRALCTDNESDEEQGEEAIWVRARIHNRFGRVPGCWRTTTWFRFQKRVRPAAESGGSQWAARKAAIL